MKDSNLCKVCLLPGAIADLCADVIANGKVTLSNRYGLMASVLNNSLTEEEEYSINRLLYAVRRGRLKIVDEL